MTFTIAAAEGGIANATAEASSGQGTAFNAWVAIAANGEISIMTPATEMGQGSLTALPLILAEELDADWSKVVVVPAPPIDKIYGNPGFGCVMHAASSAAVTGFFTVLRMFGAQVRAVLLNNVARHWNVPRAELTTEPSIIVHAKSGRRISYGEIAAFAEIPSVAPEVKPEALKKASNFRLISHDVTRI
jgi:isoquinoline 1-oxidoreductase subunit beta